MKDQGVQQTPVGEGADGLVSMRPGSGTVGMVVDLAPLPALAVGIIRLWCDGPLGRDRVTARMAETLAPASAERAVDALVSIWVLLAWQGRRPLMSHRPGTEVFCSDEAALALLIETAARGERQDAMLIASLLVRPEAAGDLTDAAQTLGSRLAAVTAMAAPTDEALAGAEIVRGLVTEGRSPQGD